MILKENASQERGRGRPKYSFASIGVRLVCFALYVDSWTLRAAIVDMDGNLICPLQRYVGGEVDATGFLKAQQELTDELLKNVPDGSEVLGIGVSVPGSVDTSTLLWRESQRWQNIRDVDFNTLQGTNRHARFALPGSRFGIG